MRVGELLAIVVLIFSATGVEAIDPQSVPKHIPLPVSIISLIAHPQRYDGHVVGLKGWLQVDDAQGIVYLSSEALRLHGYGEGIWVDFRGSGLPPANLEAANHKYVLIRALFDASRHGDMGLYQGTLTGITLLEVLGSDGLPRGTVKRIDVPEHHPTTPQGSTTPTLSPTAAAALKEAGSLEKQFGKIGELSMFSHAGPQDGPTFHGDVEHLYPAVLQQMERANWDSYRLRAFTGTEPLSTSLKTSQMRRACRHLATRLARISRHKPPDGGGSRSLVPSTWSAGVPT